MRRRTSFYFLSSNAKYNKSQGSESSNLLALEAIPPYYSSTKKKKAFIELPNKKRLSPLKQPH